MYLCEEKETWVTNGTADVHVCRTLVVQSHYLTLMPLSELLASIPQKARPPTAAAVVQCIQVIFNHIPLSKEKDPFVRRWTDCYYSNVVHVTMMAEAFEPMACAWDAQNRKSSFYTEPDLTPLLFACQWAWEAYFVGCVPALFQAHEKEELKIELQYKNNADNVAEDSPYICILTWTETEPEEGEEPRDDLSRHMITLTTRKWRLNPLREFLWVRSRSVVPHSHQIHHVVGSNDAPRYKIDFLNKSFNTLQRAPKVDAFHLDWFWNSEGGKASGFVVDTELDMVDWIDNRIHRVFNITNLGTMKQEPRGTDDFPMWICVHPSVQEKPQMDPGSFRYVTAFQGFGFILGRFDNKEDTVTTKIITLSTQPLHGELSIETLRHEEKTFCYITPQNLLQFDWWLLQDSLWKWYWFMFPKDNPSAPIVWIHPPLTLSILEPCWPSFICLPATTFVETKLPGSSLTYTIFRKKTKRYWIFFHPIRESGGSTFSLAKEMVQEVFSSKLQIFNESWQYLEANLTNESLCNTLLAQSMRSWFHFADRNSEHKIEVTVWKNVPTDPHYLVLQWKTNRSFSSRMHSVPDTPIICNPKGEILLHTQISKRFRVVEEEKAPPETKVEPFEVWRFNDTVVENTDDRSRTHHELKLFETNGTQKINTLVHDPVSFEILFALDKIVGSFYNSGTNLLALYEWGNI